MEGMPRLAFAAALTVALTLTLLLAVLLLLLANLFCSLLRRRATSRRCREPAPSPEEPSVDRPLSFPFYAHGVLQAPTKFLLSEPSLEEAMAMAKTARPTPSPPPRKAAEDFVCISNPIYDGVSLECGGGGGGGDGSTPFVTPKASPSGLEADDDDEEGLVAAREVGGDDCSPPLKLMKKLPPAPLPRTTLAACLVDGRRSLATSTETNRPSSSSSSNSLCSSPSW